MHPVMCLMLLASTSCLAHYRGAYDSRNFIVREETSPVNQKYREIVECPVCEYSEHWMASNENCTMYEGNKAYKTCMLGTYTNEVCGNRRDCYSGPGEPCTEKHEFDMLGKRCAAGYYCNKSLGVCTGLGFSVDSTTQWRLNRYPYTWRRSDKAQPDSFAPIRN